MKYLKYHLNQFENNSTNKNLITVIINKISQLNNLFLSTPIEENISRLLSRAKYPKYYLNRQ